MNNMFEEMGKANIRAFCDKLEDKDDSQEGKKGNPKVFIIDQVHTF